MAEVGEARELAVDSKWMRVAHTLRRTVLKLTATKGFKLAKLVSL